jgi:AcrR family transcriptional regulator
MDGDVRGRSVGGTGSDTKELILVEARKLFARKGFGGASMEALVKATGLSKGALYWHFPSKLAIYMDVADREARRVEAFFTPSKEDRREGLLNFLIRRGDSFIEECMTTNPDTLRFWINFLGEGLRGNEQLETCLKEFSDNAVERLCDNIESCFPEEACGKRSELRELGFIVDAVFDGVVLQLALRKDMDRAKRIWSAILSGVLPQYLGGGERECLVKGART